MRKCCATWKRSIPISDHGFGSGDAYARFNVVMVLVRFKKGAGGFVFSSTL
jgi:hypothetical protein